MSTYTINENAARLAMEANSFREYQEGSATAGYQSMVAEATALADAQAAKVDPMYHEKIYQLLDTYCRKLADNLNASYQIDASYPSILVAGGSNFSASKKNVQNKRRDANLREFNEIQGILDKIQSVGTGGIRSDDCNAEAKLQAKLESLEQLQTHMKAVNAYYRKNKTLDECPDLGPEEKKELTVFLLSGLCYEKKPFPSYKLTNNNANIKRVRDRISSIHKAKEAPPEGWAFDGGRVEANSANCRLQVFFDEKPDAEIRNALKREGFRWTPSLGVWQRQLTENAVRAAKRIPALAPISVDEN
jgi:hypothetical protein